ncbi:hypothetical protein HGRIS_006552 [Hohenbuehelia grisea]|uniref:Uncharacterized protein n=1 Tax=Hohenbuehelia grisea TaxID=104357 RepID=A0ABR3J9V2_9AGAR
MDKAMGVETKQLVDKISEKRKAAALDLEKSASLSIFNQLIDCGHTAIALGIDVAPYTENFVDPPLLDCFVDPENRKLSAQVKEQQYKDKYSKS